MKLHEAVAATQELYWRRAKDGERSLQRAEQCIRILPASLRKVELTDRRCREILGTLTRQLEGRMGNSTANRYMAALSKVLRTAYDQGHLNYQPHWLRFRESPRRRRVLKLAELNAMTAATLTTTPRQPWMANIWPFLYHAGLRPGELCNLKRTDLRDRRAHVETGKSEDDRIVPLTSVAWESASGACLVHAQPRVFPTTPKKMVEAWNRAKAYLGLQHDSELVPYSLRHTCATRLAEREPIALVQRLMGHKSIETTMRYVHVRDRELDAMRDRMESYPDEV